LHALRERGVEYVEVRLMDLDPFAPAGITAQTMRLLDVFLLHCVLRESPPETSAQADAIARNQERVAGRGREPGLRLASGNGEVTLIDWGREVLDECAPIAAALDAASGNAQYSAALKAAAGTLADPSTTPSARVLATMAQRHENSYTAFVLAQSRAHREALQ